jgi:hypothetical protein
LGSNYFLRRGICPTCGHPESEIHVGKSSYGWTFTFRGYRNEWDDVKTTCEEDWRKLLSEEGAGIFDEYGKEHAVAVFWDMVDTKRNSKNNHALHVGSANDAVDGKGNSFTFTEFR